MNSTLKAKVPCRVYKTRKCRLQSSLLLQLCIKIIIECTRKPLASRNQLQHGRKSRKMRRKAHIVTDFVGSMTDLLLTKCGVKSCHSCIAKAKSHNHYASTGSSLTSSTYIHW